MAAHRAVAIAAVACLIAWGALAMVPAASAGLGSPALQVVSMGACGHVNNTSCALTINETKGNLVALEGSTVTPFGTNFLSFSIPGENATKASTCSNANSFVDIIFYYWVAAATRAETVTVTNTGLANETFGAAIDVSSSAGTPIVAFQTTNLCQQPSDPTPSTVPWNDHSSQLPLIALTFGGLAGYMTWTPQPKYAGCQATGTPTAVGNATLVGYGKDAAYSTAWGGNHYFCFAMMAVVNVTEETSGVQNVTAYPGANSSATGSVYSGQYLSMVPAYNGSGGAAPGLPFTGTQAAVLLSALGLVILVAAVIFMAKRQRPSYD
jgi:hypothetical protein